MDSTKKYDNPSPEVSANIFSKIFFCWILPLFKTGYKKSLQTSDIYNTLNSDKCDAFVNTLQRHWENEITLHKQGKRNKPSLKIALLKTYALPYSIQGLYIFIQVLIIKTLQPIVLGEFIKYFSSNKKYDLLGKESGWILGTATVILAFFFALSYHHSNLGSQRIGMRARAACSSLVYRKLLRLSQVSLNKTPGGKLVNLLSNDLQRFDTAATYLHYIWVMPFQAAICFYIMYENVGIAALAGTIFMLLEGIPMQGYFSRVQGKLRSKIAEKTDFRVKLMNELVSGIKVIKMYAWEKYFAKVVEQARGKELKSIRATSQIKGFHVALMVITERLSLYLTTVTGVLLENTLTANRVFTTAQLFNSLQAYVCFFFPNACAAYYESLITIRRLEEVLLLEEKDEYACEGKNIKEAIMARNILCVWHDRLNIALNVVSFNLVPGSLCMVVGTVGSGKSSLLQMLLGELPIKSGKLEVSGEFSYASQEPWLFVSSVKENILFGRSYIRERYNEVVRVCALETDFQQFPFGDKTIVEERGVSLSGGQRARINLARAVYADADIYLLDDPLSAVDTRVGKHLFDKCIRGYLGGKTRILVTHQLQFLKNADVIVVIEQGQIKKIGSFSELSENYLKSLEENKTEEDTEVDYKEVAIRKQSRAVTEIKQALLQTEDTPEENVEAIGKGTIPFSTYGKYFGFGTSVFGFCVMIFLFLLAQVASNAGDLWLTTWVNRVNAIRVNQTATAPLEIVISNQTSSENYSRYNYSVIDDDVTSEEQSTPVRDRYIIVYSITIILALLLTPIRSLNFYRVIMNSSRNMHKKMFSKVLEAPMRFFDTNPSGRILSRFSNDMGIIDELLPRAMLDASQIFLVLIGILVLVFIKIVWMIIPAFILGILFYYTRELFLKTAQDVKRLEGVSRAPVYSHLIATLDGMTTIRASKSEEMVIQEFEVLLDNNSAVWYIYIAACEIFGFYLDCISTVFIAMVTYQFLIFDSSDSDVAGNAGLVLSQSLILTGMLQMGVRQTAEVANNMTSVERVLQYTTLDKETGEQKKLSVNNLVATYKALDKDWPQAGQIEFQNVFLRYTLESTPVLKNLNLVFRAGEKIGVVGRTGAGKSSLVSALFRLSPLKGLIKVDGVDTASIKLSELRSKISIIPQEPVLFSANVRYNLDPFNTVSDEQIWQALEHVELKNSITDLDMEIREGGSNFSTGQRQLMCLARAIVRNNKILVLDEATANVDPSTDALIQKAIRKNFKFCTVITIAHRLNTIMDSDKVLVMDSGECVEFDHPHVLLKDDEGYFSRMLKETGTVTENALKLIAQEHYRKLFLDEQE